MARKLVNLTFPAGGINRSLAYQSQPPYTTHDAANVRVFETYERRARGGSRGGLLAALTKHADMGAAIRYLGTVGWVDSGVRKECIVAIEGTDLFYSNTGTTFTKVAAAVTAGTTQLFAGQKQQKLYIADPAAAGDAQIRVFDPSAGTVANNTATTGTTPDDCPLCCVYRDRLVVAGPNHLWYMSRVCTPTDWNYACDVDDPARAVAGSNSDAGMIGELITAMIPHGDMGLLFGYYNSIWQLNGDPAYGGQLRNLSRDIGIISGTAWCRTPEGVLVFLSPDGLYGLQQGSTAFPEPLSRERLPDSLLGLSGTDYIVMGYSIEEGGIHISRTPAAGGGEHWFFDWRTKGFWRDVLPAESQPTYCCQYAKDLATPRRLLFGTRGGYVLRFDDDTAADNDSAGGTANPFTSYVLIGPLSPGSGDYFQGRVHEIYGTLDESSVGLTWGLLVGQTAEQAMNAGTFMSGAWGPGRNASEHPFAIGAAIVLKLSSTTRWALESATMKFSQAGRELVT